MAKLRSKGRHSKALLRQIADFERLVELRDLMLAKNAPDTQKLQSEFYNLLLPYAEDSGVKKEDIDEELFDAREQMAKLCSKGRHSKALLRKIADFERLVRLRDLMVSSAQTGPPTNSSAHEDEDGS